MSNFARFMQAAAGTTAASGSGGGTQDSSGYFANTAFLLKTSSTSGENLTTVVDTSASSHGVTRNTYSKVSSWNNFRATDTTNVDASDSDFFQVASGQLPALNYIQVPAGNPFAYGTGDFTFETWWSPMGLGTYYLWTQTVSGSNYVLWSVTGTTNYGAWMGHPASGYTNTYYSWPQGYRLYKWYHLAMVRESNSLKQYVNGQYLGSVTNTVDFSNTTYVPTLGTYTHSLGSALVQGRFYNFRISKVARYTGTTDFNPTMELYTNDSDTSILISSNDDRNAFKDLSTNNHTITYSQTDAVSGRRALVGNWWTKGNAIYKNEYLPSTHGGSIKLNRGTGEYMQVADSTDFDFGSDDWCVECWFWIDEVSTALHTLFAFGNPSNLYKMLVGFRPSNNGLVYGLSSNGSSWDIAIADQGAAGYGIVGNNSFIRRWNHLAFVRNGQNISAFVNGTKDFELTGITASLVSNNYGPTLGAVSNDTSAWCGHISQFRVVKGSSVYDPTAATITVPTSKLTAITNTKLLLDFKPSIYDVTTNNFLRNGGSAVSDVETSSAVTKYADTSVYFDGGSQAWFHINNNGDYDNNYTSARFTYERDFTIEMWVYQLSLTAQIIWDQRPASTQGQYPAFYINGSGSTWTYRWYTGTADRITSSNIPVNTWHHVAITRSGSTITMWLDGVSQGTHTNSNVMLCDPLGPVVGINGVTRNANYFHGHIEDLRITDGHARYTSAFTPPTAALPTYG